MNCMVNDKDREYQEGIEIVVGVLNPEGAPSYTTAK